MESPVQTCFAGLLIEVDNLGVLCFVQSRLRVVSSVAEN